MYIERVTNVVFFSRTKTYNVNNGCVRVYDYPINSVISPNVKLESKSLYNIYTTNSDTITLDVGYKDETEVPDAFIDVALVMVKVMYYEQETQQSFKEALPGWAVDVLNTHKRFIL